MKAGRENPSQAKSRKIANASAPKSPNRTARKDAPDPYAQIVAMAGEARSKPRSYCDFAALLVRTFESPYGAIHVRLAAQVVQDEYHHGPNDPKFWKDQVQAFLTESLTEGQSRAKLLKAKSSGQGIAFLSAPMFDSGGAPIGAVALVIEAREHSDCVTRLASLESLCRLASFCISFSANANSRAAANPDRPIARGAGASMIELAFSLSNELCNKLGCEQVALGLVRRKKVRLISISGLDHISHRSPGVTTLRAAMEECLDAGDIVEHPHSSAEEHHPAERGPTGIRTLHLHKHWHAATKGSAVASMPLHMGKNIEAVVSFRSRPENRIPLERLKEIQSKVEPYVPSLLQARRADRGLLRHAAESASEGVRALGKPGHKARRIAAGVVAAATIFIAFGTWDYNVSAPCVLMPGEVRNVRVPVQGVLTAAHVIAGDRVQRGDVLCEFDHRELDQEKVELLAQLEVYARQRDRAMAATMPSEAKLAEAEHELTQARLEIVQRRIDQMAIRSPIDGVILNGDLRSTLGGVLAKGDPLFQIAPDRGWKVEIELPERAAADISGGLRGWFAPFARPETSCEFKVERVLPTAQLRHNHNVFVAEANIDGAKVPLRAGMEGVGKVRVGRRPVWWLLSHGITDYLHLHLWL